MIVFLFFGWTVYNLPALIVGIKCLQKGRFEGSKRRRDDDELVSFSLIVPMKNEVKVAKRILESLLKLDYPAEKFEILVVDDGSTDGTSAVCKRFARSYPKRIKYLRMRVSKGKPAALNYALKFAAGDVVGVFDADNIPERSTLAKVVKYFGDQDVTAVQGLIRSINAEENMLTKMIYYESLLQYQVFWQGKDRLGLFVPLAGTCQFIRREVLVKIGGWLDGALSEDMELSARLMENGYATKLASDVCSWQENPTSFRRLMKQRLRWFRGCMEVGLRYGKLMKHFDRKSFDAEVFFFAPFILAFSVVGYLLGAYSFVAPISFGSFPNVLPQFMSISLWITLFLAGVGLVYAVKPRTLGNVKWLPFIYLYWSIQVFVALYALGQIVLRRPRKWWKTARSGIVTNSGLW